MIRLTAAQLACDRCKAESEVFLGKEPPPGWLMKVDIWRPDGLVWMELCPNCATLPFAKLMEPVNEPAVPAV